ncbi:hypothetical protein LCGC14_0745670 [marine sediment metagenome]|uniref:Acetyltransferase n=2 Tax=root TaxID=1 RepID=A0A831QN73_9FLAO|nr:acetyltransferase [Pricia sp.]HEA21789.1 acetyltransferase [Pricia antarctica]
MKSIVIIGASGHGGMIVDCIEKEGLYDVLGFIDSFKKKGTKLSGYQILGSEEQLPHLIDKFNIKGAILAIGNNWTRKLVSERVSQIAPDLEYVITIHPSAIIGKDVRIGKGSVIMPGAIINANAIVGNFCILNTNSSLGHDGKMHDFSSIASGSCTGGNLRLGQFSAISLGSNIIESITVGEHSVIGAGSLVVNNVNSYEVVYGSPARFVRRRNVEDPYLSGDTQKGEEPILIDW